MNTLPRRPVGGFTWCDWCVLSNTKQVGSGSTPLDPASPDPSINTILSGLCRTAWYDLLFGISEKTCRVTALIYHILEQQGAGDCMSNYYHHAPCQIEEGPDCLRVCSPSTVGLAWSATDILPVYRTTSVFKVQCKRTAIDVYTETYMYIHVCRHLINQITVMGRRSTLI